MNEDRTICIDIDGVIAGPPEHWPDIVPHYDMCTPISGACFALKVLKGQGWTIHLYTGRHILNAEVTLKWLKKHEIPHDLVVFGKPPARLYIDDRAVRFTNWDEMLEIVEGLD